MLKLNSEFLKKENFSVEIQNLEDRKEFENLIKTFIFNQVINRSYSYLKNKKSELTGEKYVRLVEFIRKYCLNKVNPNNYDFDTEISNRNLNFNFDSFS